MSVQQLLLGASGAAGYNLNRSVRLRLSASAYLNRTPGSAGNRKTWTWSGWVKRGLINHSAALDLFSASGTSFDNAIQFTGGGTNDILRLQLDGNNAGVVPSAAFYRDPSAWYHIVVAVDTTQATAANRVKIYVNGAEIVYGTTTYPTLNYDTMFNSTNAHNIGRSAQGSNLYFDGYLAEVNFIGGQSLTPASFGSTNELTGVWQPKAYGGAYGTNGFYLKFTDNSSVAALGTDFSGNGNTWTVNNISLTAGVTYDSMTDVPTLTSATAANYAVMNPLVPAFADTSAFSMGSGNLAFQGNNGYAFSTIPLLNNSFYCEFTSSTAGTSIPAAVGIWQLPFNHSISGFQNTNYRYSGDIGEVRNQAGTTIQTYSTFNSGDVIGVAFNASNGSLFFSKNGTWLGSSNPSTNTNPAVTGLTGSWVFGALSANQPSCWINFGQRPFAYTPPTGFVALNTFNLPTATILKGNTQMDATLYTGTLLSNTITNAGGFQPDLVWIKSRSAATDHELTDSVRGVTKSLTSNLSAAEATDVQGLTAFNSGGFTVGTNTTYNNLAATYVGWQWKGGGAAVSNTSGTITTQVSVNASAGFSIITYTGNSTSGATVGHGLGVAPKFWVIKRRDFSGDWKALSNVTGSVLMGDLNTQNTWSSPGSPMTTAPTSSVITLDASGDRNGTGQTYVIYAFAEISGFSKITYFDGNGSTDGPFVYTGFRPKFTLSKDIEGGSYWAIMDSTRSPFNVASALLNADLNNSESSSGIYDYLSNGVKLRSGTNNQNNHKHILISFAENPFKNSLAR